jgi:protein involved in polysaccharide export with SLBB domain
MFIAHNRASGRHGRVQLVIPGLSRALVAAVATLVLSGCLPKRPDFMIRTERAMVPLVDGTRAQLAARVAELEQVTSDGSLTGDARTEAVSDLALLRARLDNGDFQVGDQLIVTVSRDEVQVDTATVREGKVVSFAALPDVSLAGLLRTEAQGRLQEHLDRYRKEFSLRVNVLTRVQVVGQVTRPGFYNISRDRPVSEVIMMAGGPTPASKLDDVSIRRDRRLIVKPSQWREAVKSGTTIAQLGLQPGDEVEVAGRRQGLQAVQIVQIGFLAVSGTFAIIQLLNWIYAEPE